MQCPFCKKKLSLFRSVMGEQFCSEDHEFLYRREQQQIFAERILGSGQDQPLFEEAGPDLAPVADDAVVLFPDAGGETAVALQALSAIAPPLVQKSVRLPDGAEAAFALEKPLPHTHAGAGVLRPSQAAPEFDESSRSPRRGFIRSFGSPALEVSGPAALPIRARPPSGAASACAICPHIDPQLPIGEILIPRLNFDLAGDATVAEHVAEPVAEPVDDSAKPAAAHVVRIGPPGIVAPSDSGTDLACPLPLRRRLFSSLAVRPAPVVLTAVALAQGSQSVDEFPPAGEAAIPAIVPGGPLSPPVRRAAESSLPVSGTIEEGAPIGASRAQIPGWFSGARRVLCALLESRFIAESHPPGFGSADWRLLGMRVAGREQAHVFSGVRFGGGFHAAAARNRQHLQAAHARGSAEERISFWRRQDSACHFAAAPGPLPTAARPLRSRWTRGLVPVTSLPHCRSSALTIHAANVEIPCPLSDLQWFGAQIEPCKYTGGTARLIAAGKPSHASRRRAQEPFAFPALEAFLSSTIVSSRGTVPAASPR
ncbi:MAG: hypothetical protein ACRD9L_07965, partial [Bryobacteraceae bacterium]